MIVCKGGANRGRHGEGQRHLRAGVDRYPRKPLCAFPVIRLRCRPVQQVPLHMAPGSKGVRHRMAAIDRKRLIQQTERRLVLLGRLGEGRHHRAQRHLVRVRTGGRGAPDPLDLGAAQHRGDGADYVFDDPVLQLERVLQGPVEALGP